MDKLANFKLLLDKNSEKIVSDVSTDLGLKSNTFSVIGFSIENTEYSIDTNTISLLNDIELHIEIKGNIFSLKGDIYSTADVCVFLNNNLFMKYKDGVEIEEEDDNINIVTCNLANSPKFY